MLDDCALLIGVGRQDLGQGLALGRLEQSKLWPVELLDEGTPLLGIGIVVVRHLQHFCCLAVSCQLQHMTIDGGY